MNDSFVSNLFLFVRIVSVITNNFIANYKRRSSVRKSRNTESQITSFSSKVRVFHIILTYV